jgi:hypothetical protein
LNPHLLEISAWPWLERLSRGAGRVVTLGDVPAGEWDRIAGEGFEFLFLMGVWRRSAIGREIARTLESLRAEYDRVLPGWTNADVAGSPYCIQAYEPDDRMGGWAGLDAARRELKARGVGLILDFVPNHTGFDHPWIAAHPQRYVLGTSDDERAAPASFRTMETVDGRVHVACGRDPYFDPWSDVAQLNYFNPETRAAMRGVLREIAAHCDGVRCDMAMLVLNDVFERTWRRVLRDVWRRPFDEFWPGAIRSSPDLTYVAEVYWELEGVLLDQGFNFAYDKRLLDCLHAPDAGPRTRNLLAADWPESVRLARFIENHDEPRSVTTLGQRLAASAALVGTLPGMRFFFDGQMDGRRIKVPVQLGRWPDEPVDPVVRTFYDRLFEFASDDLLHEGEWGLLDAFPAGDHSFPNIVAYRWRTPSAVAVVVANLGDRQAQASLAMASDLVPGDAFDFEDRVTGATYRWTREALERTGLYVRLDAGAAHLFLVHAVHAGELLNSRLPDRRPGSGSD